MKPAQDTLGRFFVAEGGDAYRSENRKLDRPDAPDQEAEGRRRTNEKEETMIRRLGAILVALALVLSIGLVPGVVLATNGDIIAGNDVIDRDYGPDSWSNFYLMDQNNGFDDDSVMTAFSVYVGRTRPFHFVVYNDAGEGWEVVYDSGAIVPTEVSVLYTQDITPVCVPAGSYVGLYYPEDGAVPYSRGETHFEWNTLERVVLFTDQGGSEVDFLHSGDRVYSIAAHGFSVDDWDLDYAGDLFLPADDVILQATLTGTDTAGHSVDFYLDDDYVGSAETDAYGVAELNLGAYASGIYNVTAEVYCFEAIAEIAVYEARVAGGGQILADSGILHRNGRDINWRISFGLGAYIVNDQYWLDGCEVTFHHVSNADVVKGKFVATSLTEMNFFGDGTVANFTVLGDFNDTSGYRMIIRLQDSGEPGWQDNVRFELWEGGTRVYDSYLSGDFPGQSSDFGTARNLLDRGNLQVEDLR